MRSSRRGLLILPALLSSAASNGSPNVHGSSAPAGGSACAEPLMPHVMHAGELLVDRPVAETHTIDERTLHLRLLHDDPELQVTYVHGLFAEDEIESLVNMAGQRQGWVRSPLKTQQAGESLEGSDRRNSSSCPMLWPLVYANRRDALAARNPDLLAELDLVSKLTSRVAALFTATGLEISLNYIEPLQLVRYASTEHFGPHHDYHEVGPDGRLGSSVQGEQRAFTVLIFGSTLGPDDGGETHFPRLDLSVSPRLGDAIVWANVGADGAPNPRSLHQGRPPVAGVQKIAINCWVADREFSSEQRLDGAVRTGT